jgi:3-deoxy-7-phosphoheptulonate synthase
MIIVVRPSVTDESLDRIVALVESTGCRAHVSRGAHRTIVGCIGDERALDAGMLAAIDDVERVFPVLTPYKLASREYAAGATHIPLGDAARTVIGGDDIVVIAGPCSVEGREMLDACADAALQHGARALRGGAFKPRTSPYAFQGLGDEALHLLADVRRRTGLPIVTEVMDPRQVEQVAEVADVLQIGARNMQNFPLLREVGMVARPVLLKRGLSATVSELLMAAEYVLAQGTTSVMLCERGIRTFETATRNTFDVAAVPVLKRETHLPVLVDPSHAAGRADLVTPLALGAIAAGADGLLVEIHPNPVTARSDGDQSLTFAAFGELMTQVRRVADAVGRAVPECVS